MRSLSTDEADIYLRGVGMKVGDWSQATDIDSARSQRRKWVHQRGPEDARRLYTFAQHVAGWIPRGEWKLLQIDNSTSLDPVQIALVAGLLFGPGSRADLLSKRSFLFEFSGEAESDSDVELTIGNLVFAFLLFEGHVQIISSSGGGERYISLQDGYAYLMSLDEESAARSLFGGFERGPGGYPEWVGDIIAHRQEQLLGSG
jgi:hypothetical protein